MASRLYPGFGTGSKPFEGDFEARSFAADSKDELSCGDKVILPQTALKEIRQLRLPLPLLFEIGPMKRMTTARSAPMMDTSVAPSRGGAAGRGRGAPKAAAGAGGVDGAAKGGGKPDAEEKEAKKSGPFRQYCGVLEFSAPAGVCLMPDWMMKNLKIRNGTTVRLISQRDPPKGKYARFRPHTTAFVDMAAALGPREVMEAALRFFSVLSVGETIQVSVSGERHALDVLEVQPGEHICLYGDLDLEVDFAPPRDTLEPLESARGAAGVVRGLRRKHEADVAAGAAGAPGSPPRASPGRVPAAAGGPGSSPSRVRTSPVEPKRDLGPPDRSVDARRWAMSELQKRALERKALAGSAALPVARPQRARGIIADVAPEADDVAHRKAAVWDVSGGAGGHRVGGGDGGRGDGERGGGAVLPAASPATKRGTTTTPSKSPSSHAAATTTPAPATTTSPLQPSPTKSRAPHPPSTPSSIAHAPASATSKTPRAAASPAPSSTSTAPAAAKPLSPRPPAAAAAVAAPVAVPAATNDDADPETRRKEEIRRAREAALRAARERRLRERQEAADA